MKLSRKKVELAMARAELNRNQAAEKAGMSIPSYCAAISRESCKPATAGKIARALGVDITEILED